MCFVVFHITYVTPWLFSKLIWDIKHFLEGWTTWTVQQMIFNTTYSRDNLKKTQAPWNKWRSSFRPFFYLLKLFFLFFLSIIHCTSLSFRKINLTVFVFGCRFRTNTPAAIVMFTFCHLLAVIAALPRRGMAVQPRHAALTLIVKARLVFPTGLWCQRRSVLISQEEQSEWGSK